MSARTERIAGYEPMRIDLFVALAEVRRLRDGIRAIASWMNDPDAYPALIALVDPSEDIYSQF